MPVRRFKLYALLLSSGFTSVAGSLYALMIGFADPDSVLGVLVSVKMVIMAALGGAGTLFGPLIGAAILIPLEEGTNAAFGGSGTGITYVVYGAVAHMKGRGDPQSAKGGKPMTDPRFPAVTVVDHPLVQHKLTLLRRKDTSTAKFRQLVREISLLMAYEITRDLPVGDIAIETPLEAMQAPALVGKKLCFVPILRAGVGILDGMLDLVPSARVGHIGLYRDPATLQAIEYYCKLPEDLPERLVVLVEPDARHGALGLRGPVPPSPGRCGADADAVPARSARGPDSGAATPSGRRRLYGRHRPGVGQPRLYPPGPWRRRGPAVRHEVAGTAPDRAVRPRPLRRFRREERGRTKMTGQP